MVVELNENPETVTPRRLWDNFQPCYQATFAWYLIGPKAQCCNRISSFNIPVQTWIANIYAGSTYESTWITVRSAQNHGETEQLNQVNWPWVEFCFADCCFTVRNWQLSSTNEWQYFGKTPTMQFPCPAWQMLTSFQVPTLRICYSTDDGWLRGHDDTPLYTVFNT